MQKPTVKVRDRPAPAAPVRPAPTVEAFVSGDPAVPLPLVQLVFDDSVQTREQRNQAVIDEYAEAIERGESFPPLLVYQDVEGVKRVVDGFHRGLAGLKARALTLPCLLRPGSLEQAQIDAVGLNGGHGLRRTNADKRREVLRLLAHKDWRGESAHVIAKKARVDHSMVSRIRAELREASAGEPAHIEPPTGEKPQLSTPERFRGQDGKMRPATLPRVTRLFREDLRADNTDQGALFPAEPSPKEKDPAELRVKLALDHLENAQAALMQAADLLGSLETELGAVLNLHRAVKSMWHRINKKQEPDQYIGPRGPVG